METAQHSFLPLFREYLQQGFTNQETANALNRRGFRTPGASCLWTKDTVSQYRCRNRDIVEDVDNERLRHEWAAVPMPEYPRAIRLRDDIILAGVPFFDTGVDGELNIPAPALK